VLYTCSAGVALLGLLLILWKQGMAGAQQAT